MLEEFLQSIGITEEGKYQSDGSYVIDIDNSDDFGKIFSKLDKCKDLEEMEQNTVMNLFATSLLYVSDDFQFNLIQDFTEDSYKLVVTEL